MLSQLYYKSLALFWMGILVRNPELLQTLTNKKWPLGIDPGGHHLVVLNVSINKKPISPSEVAVYEKEEAYHLQTASSSAMQGSSSHLITSMVICLS